MFVKIRKKPCKLDDTKQLDFQGCFETVYLLVKKITEQNTNRTYFSFFFMS
jgi:hypothetical protein